MTMTNIVADGRQRDVLHGFLAVTICDTQIVQSLLQQVRVSTNAPASRLSLAALQQFVCNKGLVLLHSFNCEPKRWVKPAAETICSSFHRVEFYTYRAVNGNKW